MSTICDAPVSYDQPGQYIDVAQGPPVYGDAPVDNGGTLAQNDGDAVAQTGVSAGDPGVTVDSTDDTSADLVSVTAVPHHTRYLRVANITGGKLKVYLQYFTQDESGEWDWSPDAPNKEADSFAVDLDPNEASDITDGNWRVNASKVRIWAKSDDGKEWNKFKTVDLNLVPETDAAGTPTYLADNEETFCFTIK
jgi:hypothetical protein